ncbi:MAG: hypothetical protein Q7K16_04765 [Candidatus Azambacteria bacterium]|nr:hypothetical protein [Candidatus Azambacteria bacterium]
MSIVTIPKKLIKGDDVVVLPRKEYEKLFSFWASAERITKRDKLSIVMGLKEIENGKFFTSRQVGQKLGL